MTLDGKPVVGATVIMTPVAGRAATGTTGTDGVAVMSTYGDRDGAILGKHTAIVAGPAAGSASFNPDQPAVDSGVPSIYGEPGRSGLSCEVKSGQKNVVKFELTGKRP